MLLWETPHCPCAFFFSLGVWDVLLLFSFRQSVGSWPHHFCESERIVKDFLYSWGSVWSPDISWSQVGCVQLPVSHTHDSESPQLAFQLLKNLFKYQTALKRQEAWDFVKRYAIFTLRKCTCFLKMLFKMIFAFQSHQVTLGYIVSNHSQSSRACRDVGFTHRGKLLCKGRNDF